MQIWFFVCCWMQNCIHLRIELRIANKWRLNNTIYNVIYIYLFESLCPYARFKDLGASILALISVVNHTCDAHKKTMLAESRTKNKLFKPHKPGAALLTHPVKNEPEKHFKMVPYGALQDWAISPFQYHPMFKSQNRSFLPLMFASKLPKTSHV